MAVRSRSVVPMLGVLAALAVSGCNAPHTGPSPFGYGPRIELCSETLAAVSRADIEVHPIQIGSGDGEGALLYLRLLAHLEQERQQQYAGVEQAADTP